MATDREERDWKRLQGVYKYQGLVLALGAGLSYGSGIPTWVGLLERLGHGDRVRGGAMIGKPRPGRYRLHGFDSPEAGAVLAEQGLDGG